MMRAKSKKVTILGLGATGLAGARFLSNQGYQVFVSELCDNKEMRNRAEELSRMGIQLELGQHTETAILDAAWILVSPGISPGSSIYQRICRQGIPLHSEIEVASWFCPTSRVIAVTGTCGKTTVTTLLTRALRESGKRVVCCGNIGNPWIGEISNLGTDDYVVLEVSSFQLEHCQSFHPKIGILLNLSPNHRDWHPTMASYANAKWNLFKHQRSHDHAFFKKGRSRSVFFGFISLR